LLCNIIRIVVTGILHETAGHELANYVFHDVAGWLMGPLALVFLLVELKLLSLLFPGESLDDSNERSGQAASQASLLGKRKDPIEVAS
jgi:hypothetical protein